MKSLSVLLTELEAELYLKSTGYTTAIEVEPGGTKNGLGSNACAYEIVVLDFDGDTIAYRYSDDSINEDWKIGTLGEVVDAVLNTQIERIEAELSDEDIAAWHAGETDDKQIFTDLVERFGAFQVWGSRHGAAPLTIAAA